MNKAIFLDKDGTLIENVPYNTDSTKIHFYEGVVDSLLDLKDAGFLLVVISNQSGIGKGYFTLEQFESYKREFCKQLQAQGVVLDGFYYCPHVPEDACACRKPLPGLFRQAARDLSIDLTQSFMIGDILHDVEAGKKAGCTSIFINSGNETEWVLSPTRTPDFVASDIIEACEYILDEQQVSLLYKQHRLHV